MFILLSFITDDVTGIYGIIGIYKQLLIKYFNMLTGFAAGIMLAIATFGLVDKSISFLSGSSPPFIIAIIIVFQIRSKMLILLFLNKILINLHSLDNS
ncbi:MAG: hypothetical protein ACFFD2_06725 [Promethearchaeota archaeon]